MNTSLPSEQRIDPVLRLNGISFINDSFSHSVNSAWFALESICTPIVWITGANHNHGYQDFSPIQHLSKKIKAIVCVGNSDLFTKNLKTVQLIITSDTILNAIKSSQLIARKGDTVIYSPCDYIPGDFMEALCSL